jgi:hypothetical protein
MSVKFYHYEDIAKWWLDNNISEAKLKRLFPEIDMHKLRVFAMQWANDPFASDNFEWGYYLNRYDDPVHFAQWIIHPDNDSAGCNWFRAVMRDFENTGEIMLDSYYNALETIDDELWGRFENFIDCWGEMGSYWLKQIAFYAIRIQDDQNGTDYGDIRRAA